DGDGRSDFVFDPPKPPIAIGLVDGELVVAVPACSPRRAEGFLVERAAEGVDSALWSVRRTDDDPEVDRFVVGEVPRGFEERQALIPLPDDDLLEISVTFRETVRGPGRDLTSLARTEVRLSELPTDGQLLVVEAEEAVGTTTEDGFQRTLVDSGCDEWPGDEAPPSSSSSTTDPP
ncbi:MAG TPA: hypothetical protein VGO60_12325, partial [Iamia sp.]|nr:hypothetical protein [Iamia sp.]